VSTSAFPSLSSSLNACPPLQVLESKNIALQGTLCTSGNGFGICIGLGDGTVFGRITKDVARERPGPTTLEVEIRRFVLIIAGLAISVAIVIISQ
jgi:sodium/potassium-transporting ATPase subunit alpha